MLAQGDAPTIPPRALNALRAVSALDGLLLVALAYFAARREELVVASIAPTHGMLFLVLVLSLTWAVDRGWWGWQFVVGVCLLGPLVSTPGLEVVGARQRARRGDVAA